MGGISKTNQATVEHIIEFSSLKQNAVVKFDEHWSDAQAMAICDELGIKSLKKLSIKGEIRAQGAKDWRLDAVVGASAVQSCVVTLEDIKTRLDVAITREYLHNFDEYESENTSEEELDAEIEPIPSELNLLNLVSEVISLNLDDYPRKDGTVLESTLAAPAGVEPLTDDAVKPFAALASLKDKLKS